MGFDLSSAKPVAMGFDLSSATPIKDTRSPMQQLDALNGVTNAASLPPATPSLFDKIKALANVGLGTAASTITAPLANIAGALTPGNSEQNAARYLSKIGPGYTPGSLENEYASNLSDAFDRSKLAGLPIAGNELGALAQGIKTGSGFIAPALSAYAEPAVANAAIINSLNAPKAAMVNSALDSGFKLPPSAINPSFINRKLEGFAGKTNTQNSFSLNNQPVTNQMVRDGFGLASDTPLKPEVYQSIRDDAVKAGYEPLKAAGNFTTTPEYQAAINDLKRSTVGDYGSITNNPEVDHLITALQRPTMDSADAVFLMRQLRDEAHTNLGPMVTEPNKKVLGRAQNAAANAIENMAGQNLNALETSAPGQGYGDILKNFNDARTRISQSYNAQSATNPVGNVDAVAIAAQLNAANKAGSPYTGPLRSVGEFGTIANGAAKLPEKVDMAATPLNQTLTAGVMGGLGAGGASMLGFSPSMTGATAAIVAGLPIVKSGVRSLIGSRAYQQTMARMPNASASIPASIINRFLPRD